MYEIDRRTVLTGLSAILVAGCTTPSPAPKYPEITFTHVQPFRFDAASLDIVDTFKPAFSNPFVEHLMPISPAASARRWAGDRIALAGESGRVVFTIIDASVTETPLKRTTGVRGVVTSDQSERYDARLQVKLAVRSGDGRQRGEVMAEANRSRTVAENLSLNERERVWFEMTEVLISELNGELETAIRKFLQPFLI